MAVQFLNALDQLELRREIMDQMHDQECDQILRRARLAIDRLLRRPWFRRCWTRQELFAGRKVVVQCGIETISWTVLKRSSIRIGHIRHLKDDIFFTDPVKPNDVEQTPHLGYLKRSWTYGETVYGTVAVSGSIYYWHGGGLLDLLITGTYFNATDPRDKVYSVLGLAREPIADGENEDALFPCV